MPNAEELRSLRESQSRRNLRSENMKLTMFQDSFQVNEVLALEKVLKTDESKPILVSQHVEVLFEDGRC